MMANMYQNDEADSSLPTTGSLDRPIYFRLLGESDKAYSAFCYYRDLGYDRSITKVTRGCHKSHGLISRWNSRYHWAERIRAWEDHLDRVAMEKAEKARKDMVDRHIRLSSMLQSVGTAKLLEWHKQVQAWQQDPQHNQLPNLTPSDVVRLIELGIRIERLCRGESTEVVDPKQIQYVFLPPRK